MSDYRTTDDLASELRTIADTLDGPSGWGIAAIKVRGAAEILERINMLACYASEENTDARAAALLEIGKLARGELEP